MLEVPSEKICVVYPGIDAARFAAPVETLTSIKAAFKLPDRFLLMVGTIEPRKNHRRVFEAYRILKDKLGAGLPPLVLAGKKGYQAEKILARIQELGLSDSIYYLGLLGEEQLQALYRLAHILLYPSLGEGFGFPILEAMAAETAVVTGRTSSMPEVGGEAALYVDPDSAEEIAAKTLAILENRELHAALVHQGLARVQRFSWRETAEAMLKVYRMAFSKTF